LASFITEVTVRKTLIDRLEDGEQLAVVARGTDLLGRPYFVGKTDKRGLVLRLSKSYEVKEEESIPLSKLDKKLKRMALVKGIYLAPPGEPPFKSDKERALFEAEKESLKQVLEPEESIMTLGLCRDPGMSGKSFYYIAFTDRRIILAKLSGKREIADVEGIPLDELESFELRHASDPVPIDIPVVTGQEERLFLQFKNGQERKLLITDLFGHRREDAPD
jgi:Bacterial PH domain